MGVTKYFRLKNGVLHIPNQTLANISFKSFKDSKARVTYPVAGTTDGIHLEWDSVSDAVFFPLIEINRRVYGNDTVVLTMTITIGTPNDGYFIRWYNGDSYVIDTTELGYKPTTIQLQTPIIPSSKLPSIRISLCTRVPERKHIPIKICINHMNIMIESPSTVTDRDKNNGNEGVAGNQLSPRPVLNLSETVGRCTDKEIGYAMIERKQSFHELLQDTLELKQLYPKSVIVFVPHIRVQTDDPILSIVMKSRERNQEMLEQVCSYFKGCHLFPLSNFIKESMLEERIDGQLDLNHYNAHGKEEIGKQLTTFLENIHDTQRK
jgi:hypothetical protein